MQVFFANSGVFKLRLQNSRFFLKISKKVKCGVRVLRARSARASHARGAPQSRSLFSTSFQTFCWLLARAWIRKNTDCFEVYSKLSFLSTCSRLANCWKSYLIGFPLLYLAFFNCIQDFRSSPSFLVFKTFIFIYGYPPLFLFGVEWIAASGNEIDKMQKNIWRENLLAHAHLWCEVHKSNIRVKRWQNKHEIFRNIELDWKTQLPYMQKFALFGL